MGVVGLSFEGGPTAEFDSKVEVQLYRLVRAVYVGERGRRLSRERLERLNSLTEQLEHERQHACVMIVVWWVPSYGRCNPAS